ncbi:hypothetical protein NDU88_006901 [Pleurodeles waltl]|uniref:Uncharacterized protein n=1 Tax=Pleurodeles waltl TaxID=8319 RepID=A0AAV7VNY1_PLEWA|nr:hypothetical protein NDU88_006901 [Pleurodeles waltl]
MEVQGPPLSEDTLMSAVENLDLANLTTELTQAGLMSLGDVLEVGKFHPGVQSQPAETWSVADLTGATTSVVSLVEIQLQKDNEPEILKEGIQDTDDKLPESHIKRTSTRNSKDPIIDGGPIAEGQDEEIGKTEWNRKNLDWSKEGGQKMYSLTEDSEPISSICNQSEDEESLSSENKTSLSPAIGPTVKQQQCRCKKSEIWLNSWDSCFRTGSSDP